jgi:hypothetical protein
MSVKARGQNDTGTQGWKELETRYDRKRGGFPVLTGAEMADIIVNMSMVAPQSLSTALSLALLLGLLLSARVGTSVG